MIGSIVAIPGACRHDATGGLRPVVPWEAFRLLWMSGASLARGASRLTFCYVPDAGAERALQPF